MPTITANLVEVFPFRRTPRGVEFLMLRRATGTFLGDTWHAVHGKVEPGETAVATAIRELREETGATPRQLWQVDHVSTYYVAEHDAVYLQPSFTAELAPDVAVTLSPEHSAFRWVPAPEAPAAFLWPNQRRAVQAVLDEILAEGPAEPHLRMKF